MLTCNSPSPALSTDRPGLRNVELVQKIHSKLDQLLQNQISLGHPNEPNLFDELKKKIPDLRTLNTLHSEKLLAIKLDAQCGAEQGEPVVSTSSASSSSSSCVDQQWSDFGSPRSVASSCDGDAKLTSHSLDLNPYSPSDQMAQFHLSSSAQSGLNATTTITTTTNAVHSVAIPHIKNGCPSPRRTPSSLSNSSTCSASSASKPGLRFGSLSVAAGQGMCPVSNQTFYPTGIQFGGMYSPVGPVSTVSAPVSIAAPHSTEEDKTPLLLRRVDSPTDSGIESGKEGNSATSVCSSPRSDSEEARSQPMVVSTSRTTSPSCVASGEAPLDDMPMLKRALQAPPLLQTTNNLLMDQAYRHHKKFRATKLQQQQQLKRDQHQQQVAESSALAMHVMDSSPISSSMLMSPTSTSTSHGAPSGLAAALQCPIGSSDQHSLARTHSTLVRTLQQQPRFASEQQLKRTDLIHNIIMRSEMSASPLMSSSEANMSMSVGLQHLLGPNSMSKFQSPFGGTCPVSSGSMMNSAPSPLMRFQPQLPSPAGSLVNAHSPPPFSSMLHASLDMQPLNLSKKPSAPITPPISPNAIKMEHGL